MNTSNLILRDYEEMDTWWAGKNEPKTNPNEPNLSRRSLWRSRIKGKKMLLRMTINTRRKSLGYYADEIEAPNTYDREKSGNRINGIFTGLLYFHGKTL